MPISLWISVISNNPSYVVDINILYDLLKIGLIYLGK